MNVPHDASLLGATIVGISPVADSVTGARRVRVEVPNAGKLPAGLTAYVRFGEPGREWAQLVESQTSAQAGQDSPGEEG